MTPGVRWSAPRVLPAQSESLAFAREQVLRSGAPSPGAGTKSGKAFTIAVTAPRLITCKRGLAANLAATLAAAAAADGSSVCVLDTDLESRDVGVRFGVEGPQLLDVANNLALNGTEVLHRSDAVARIDPPGLSVIPIRPPQPSLVPLLHKRASALLAPLQTSFDFVVIDAPIALGTGPDEWERAILRQVDVLLVAVSAEAAALGSALRYMNALAAARNSGAIGSKFETHIVLTGTEEDGSRALLTERELDRKLGGIPVIASIPQLWGRRRPDNAVGTALSPSLHDELADIVTKLTERHITEF
jgi:MinD-like ATPase involved in chromosome partitioning or flagellar assembly